MDKNDPRQQPTEGELDELNEHWQEPGDPDGVMEADEQHKWQAEHPAPATTTPPNSPKKRRWPAVLLVVVLLLVAAGIAYWLGTRKAAAPAIKTGSSTQTAPPKQTKPAVSVPTKHYDSATYNVGFDYPQTWAVADTAAKLTVISPTMALPTASGKQINGHVVVTVRNKQTTLPEFAAGPAVAALASQKLTYKQPTSIQRAQTYLSFLTYAHSTSAGLDALYITGDTGYQAGQTVPATDVLPGDPLISVTFVSCAVQDCTTGTSTPVTLATSSWSSAAISSPVTALLESISLD